MKLTRDEMVAAEMAGRHFVDTLLPVFTELKTDEAKKGYASAILINACAALSHATGDGFEDALDELVIIAKETDKTERS